MANGSGSGNDGLFNDLLGLEDWIWWIIIGAATLLLILFALCCCCCLRRARRKGREEAMESIQVRDRQRQTGYVPAATTPPQPPNRRSQLTNPTGNGQSYRYSKQEPVPVPRQPSAHRGSGPTVAANSSMNNQWSPAVQSNTNNYNATQPPMVANYSHGYVTGPQHSAPLRTNRSDDSLYDNTSSFDNSKLGPFDQGPQVADYRSSPTGQTSQYPVAQTSGSNDTLRSRIDQLRQSGEPKRGPSREDELPPNIEGGGRRSGLQEGTILSSSSAASSSSGGFNAPPRASSPPAQGQGSEMSGCDDDEFNTARGVQDQPKWWAAEALTEDSQVSNGQFEDADVSRNRQVYVNPGRLTRRDNNSVNSNGSVEF